MQPKPVSIYIRYQMIYPITILPKNYAQMRNKSQQHRTTTIYKKQTVHLETNMNQ